MKLKVKVAIACVLATMWFITVTSGNSEVLPEFNDQVFTPQTSFSYSEEVPATRWNKIWRYSAWGGQAGDLASSIYQTNKPGCTEGNKLFKGDNGMLTLAVVKLVYMGLIEWYVHENDSNPYISVESKQGTKNWLYAPAAIIGTAATTWNMTRDCD